MANLAQKEPDVVVGGGSWMGPLRLMGYWSTVAVAVMLIVLVAAMLVAERWGTGTVERCGACGATVRKGCAR